MRIISRLFLLIVASSFVIVASAQRKPVNKPVVTSTQKFKPPKLYTFLTSYKDSVSIPVAIAESIIAGKLKIYDDKKTEYTVSSYQFLYKKKTVTEDELTGKVSAASSMVSERFTVSPLPGLWIDKIREQLNAGEELYFFDVIAKDAQGRVMYASSLKILTQ